MNLPTVPGFGYTEPPRRDTPAPSEDGSEDSGTEAFIDAITIALGQSPNKDAPELLTHAEITELLIGNNLPDSDSDSDSDADTVRSEEKPIWLE